MADHKTKIQFIIISEDQSNRRIDHFLLSQFNNMPKSHLYRLLRKGEIRVNKKRVKPDYRVQTGDILRIPPLRISEEQTSTVKVPPYFVEKLANCVLYEDANLFIINKPAGIAVHGGSMTPIGLIEALRQIRSDVRFMELVHRLDRDTSGCLIIAKKHSILRELHQLLREGQIIKTYYALTMGHWSLKINRVEVPLQKNVLQSGERMVKVNSSGKKSITEFQVIREFGIASFVKVQLETGRTHQIRVHAKHVGHPIAGDEKYGDRAFNNVMRKKGLHRLFLHAYQVGFTLPGTKQHFSVKAPLDQELEDFLDLNF